MKHPLLFPFGMLLSVYLLTIIPTKAQSVETSSATAQAYNSKMSESNLLFTENLGQIIDSKGNTRPDVLFSAQSNGAKVFITATSIYYQFEKMTVPAGYQPKLRKIKDHQARKALQQKTHLQTYRFALSLQGANLTPQIRKEEQSDYTENFFLANCPNGITGVHTYNRIVLENVYPGIDWVIYTKEKGMEYDFIVHPGADPLLIKLKVSDAQQVNIAANGDLVMTTNLGTVREKAPVSYCGGTAVSTFSAKIRMAP